MERNDAREVRMALEKLVVMRPVPMKMIRAASRMKGSRMRKGATERAIRPAMPRPRNMAKMLDFTWRKTAMRLRKAMQKRVSGAVVLPGRGRGSSMKRKRFPETRTRARKQSRMRRTSAMREGTRRLDWMRAIAAPNRAKENPTKAAMEWAGIGSELASESVLRAKE